MPTTAAPPPGPFAPPIDEVDVLARTIYGEARGEKRLGRIAIANVVMNRVNIDLGNDRKPDWWGEGIIGVCLCPFQFSCWLPDDPNRNKIRRVRADQDAVFADCVELAQLAAAGKLADVTKGAVQYLNKPLTEKLYGRLPPWARTMRETVVIGQHTFYAL